MSEHTDNNQEPAQKPVTIKVDSRGRTNLGKVTKHRTFVATKYDDGTIVLEPAQVVTVKRLKELSSER